MTTDSTPEPSTPATTATDILIDAVERVHEELPGLLEGLDTAALTWRPDPDANPVGWLAWHLTRVQDDHLADVGNTEQVWTSQGFAQRFDLPYDRGAIGYGQSSQDVGAFTVPDATPLVDYHEQVHALTQQVLRRLTAQDYSRIVDRAWDPPVTAVVRLVSVVNDVTQHLGQIAYLRGMIDRGAMR